MGERMAVVGLGYVGLPLAVRLARAYEVVGFDTDHRRVDELRGHVDRNGEVSDQALRNAALHVTHDPDELLTASVFIITVPTPADAHYEPDLSHLLEASELVGSVLRPGGLVVYESTVYPGLTEEICGPVLEQSSGLVRGRDFKVAYSPERTNPGDGRHTITNVMKIVSAEDEEALTRTASVYEPIVEAGIYKAPSIMVAEAAKIVENVQRDVNVALMNELAAIFDKIGLRTKEVLDAAATKWNFAPFTPGLVGGHCVPVDPLYLIRKAKEASYVPSVVSASREVNDGMGIYVGERTVQMLEENGGFGTQTRVGVLGVAFKENVRDTRNSLVFDVIRVLESHGIKPMVHDPLVDPDRTLREYGLKLSRMQDMRGLDCLVLAVPHRYYTDMPLDQLLASLHERGVLIDVKSALNPSAFPAGLRYWSL